MTANNNGGDPFVAIHHEVYADLTYRWPYSLAAGRVAWFIARWSWGWKRARMTPWPVDTGRVAAETGLHPEVVRRELRRLQADGIVIRDRRGHAGLDKRALSRKCQHNQMVVPNTTKRLYEYNQTVVPGACNENDDNQLHRQIEKNRNMIKKNTSPGYAGLDRNKPKTAGQVDNDRQVEAMLALWRHYVGGPPVTPGCTNVNKLAQRALTRCKRIDVSPAVVVAKLANSRTPWRYFMAITAVNGRSRVYPSESGQSFADWLERITPPMPRATPTVRGGGDMLRDIFATMNISEGVTE